jgi:hypothetical protein
MVERAGKMTAKIIQDVNNDLWIEYQPDTWLCITDPDFLQKLFDKMYQDRWSRHNVTERYGPTSDILLVRVGAPQHHETGLPFSLGDGPRYRHNSDALHANEHRDNLRVPRRGICPASTQ